MKKWREKKIIPSSEKNSQANSSALLEFIVDTSHVVERKRRFVIGIADRVDQRGIVGIENVDDPFEKRFLAIVEKTQAPKSGGDVGGDSHDVLDIETSFSARVSGIVRTDQSYKGRGRRESDRGHKDVEIRRRVVLVEKCSDGHRVGRRLADKTNGDIVALAQDRRTHKLAEEQRTSGVRGVR